MTILTQTVLIISVLIMTGFSPVYANQTPCQKDVNYQAFDFWLGEWQVTNKQGVVQGTNSITKSDDGCLIHERWTSAQGNKGYSSNYYNPITKLWAQRWVSAGSVIEYTGGSEKPGQMSLEGMIYYQQNGLQAKFRGTWSLLEDGRVRQFFEQYNADKEEWSVWFEGFYSKINKE